MAQATRPAPRFASWLIEGADSPTDRAVSNPASLGYGADLVGFGGGQPAVETYPIDALERAYASAIREAGRQVLPYGATQGLPALRELICARLAQRGITAHPDNVVILTGSIQGLHLVGRITLDRGDTIVFLVSNRRVGVLTPHRSRGYPRDSVAFTVDLDWKGGPELRYILVLPGSRRDTVYPDMTPRGAWSLVNRVQRLLPSDSLKSVRVKMGKGHLGVRLDTPYRFTASTFEKSPGVEATAPTRSRDPIDSPNSRARRCSEPSVS